MSFVKDPNAWPTCRPVEGFRPVDPVAFHDGMQMYVKRTTCGECGAVLEREHVYCHHCGRRILWDGERR